MKKLILFLSLILSVGFASAQSEIPSDSIRRAPSANIKEFGGFLLDMGLMNVAPPKLPKFSLDVPNMSKDYNQLFCLFRFRIRVWLGAVVFSTVHANGIF